MGPGAPEFRPLSTYDSLGVSETLDYGRIVLDIEIAAVDSHECRINPAAQSFRTSLTLLMCPQNLEVVDLA